MNKGVTESVINVCTKTGHLCAKIADSLDLHVNFLCAFNDDKINLQQGREGIIMSTTASF